MKVSWAETLLVLNDEFREVNVSPRKNIKRMVDEAFDRLPPGEWKVKGCCCCKCGCEGYSSRCCSIIGC
jgi:hypothetical protein